jgi:sugar transferase (PEP-CTERM/EpsH1 system associated)
MNVLFLTHRLPYAPNRGDRIRAYYLLREMSRVATVSLFSLIHDDEEASNIDRVPFAHDVTGVRVTRGRNLLRSAAGMASNVPLTHRLLDAPSVSSALIKMVRTRPPDVVVAFCSGMARFALEPPLRDRPFVLDLVDVDSAKWRQLATRVRGPLRWVYRREADTLGRFEANAAIRAETTLVVNERERQALLAIAPRARVSVLPNGIEADAFVPPKPPGDSSVVIFCGVMSYFPNEEGVRWFAQHVWPRVRAARADARFMVVGMGPTRALRTLATQDRSIEIVGRVDQIEPYLWKSAVSVAPLRLAQGLQNKVLEALAAALPVVVTPAVSNGLPPEVLPGCVIAEDPTDFADAVLRLLAASPEARWRQARAARLDRLTWSERLAPIGDILHGAAAPAEASA